MLLLRPLSILYFTNRMAALSKASSSFSSYSPCLYSCLYLSRPCHYLSSLPLGHNSSHPFSCRQWQLFPNTFVSMLQMEKRAEKRREQFYKILTIALVGFNKLGSAKSASALSLFKRAGRSSQTIQLWEYITFWWQQLWFSRFIKSNSQCWHWGVLHIWQQHGSSIHNKSSCP